MTRGPAFSVVIPVYNKREHIEGTLRSVLSQTYPADEIIVVDDGSTDGSAAVLAGLSGGSVRVVSQPNRGVAAARNAGISGARNELVCLLDADDLWHPDYLAEVAALVERVGDAAFYGVGHVYVDGERAIRPKRSVGDDFIGKLDFLTAYPAGSGIICSSTVCIRKSVFETGIVFPEGKRVGEDIYYWIRLGLVGSLGFSGRTVARILRDEKSALFTSRRSEIPYYIEWLASELPSLDERARAPLTRLLRSRAIQCSLLAAEVGGKDTVHRLSQLLRPGHPALALVVRLLGLAPSWSVRMARGIKARLRTTRS